ncbi:VOC family protein [Nakamurella deserti]|uniref:VOC family protein n=1 Tax=Nakamurella deserti TaxID=2164074 RepID=UPI000DBE5278|nr:VOC family protein [Nakamurella deserti]
MPVRWYTTVIDCQDAAALARWWAGVLDWRIAYESDDEIVLVPRHAFDPTRTLPLEQRGPGLVFVPVPEDKQRKNRLHLDLAPGPVDDQRAEVERLVRLGASHVDVGQPDDASFVVLADPEGNEFCVLSPRG